MKVKVKYFAAIREKTCKKKEEIECEPETRLETLVENVEKKYGLDSRMLVSFNCKFTEDEALQNGDEVALFPPVSGG